MTADLAWAGVTGQLAALRAGVASSAELVQLVLGRLAAYDGRLGVVRHLRADAARADAADADRSRDAGDDRSLLGLPVLVKESHAVAGLPGALGTRSDEPAATGDAPIVAALRAAGAVVVASTTMPELALWPFGPARNPWDTTRTAGGSSSGSAAAVAAGLVAVATASDGGGSIRLPAAMCGLVGLKAAPGQLPGGGGWHGLSVDGVLTRSVTDTAVVLDALRGSTSAGAGTLAAAAAREPGPLRVAWWGRAPLPPRAGGQMQAALAATVAELASLGHATAEVDPGWSAAASSFVPGYAAGAADDRAGLRNGRLEPRAAVVAGLGARLPSGAVTAACGRGDRLRERVRDRLAGHDVLLLPTVPGPAPAAGPLQHAGRVATLLTSSRLSAYTSPVNAAGLASISVPAGWTRGGLPLGVQLVSPDDDLELLVSLAAQLETATGWLDRRPPGWDG